jgi:hypothetical protein
MIMLVAAATAQPSPAAWAEALDGKAITIIAKTFDFLLDRPPPGARLVVVGQAADLGRAREAFPQMMVTAGGPGDASGAFAMLVASIDEARAAQAVNPAILTIGGDMACVDAGACLLAVETRPRLTISVSRAATRAARIRFEANFKMVATER